MKITEVKCKTALSKSNLPGLDYSLNPYRGCQHNCCYCYVPNVLRIPREDWGCFVNVKTNIPQVLSKELRKRKPGVVGLSTVTDPYQPIEKKYRLARYCLEQLLIHDWPISIQTKSNLILRDEGIITRFSDAEVIVSIGTLNDSERKMIEPCSSSIEERLEVLKTFSNSNVKRTVFFGPVYPTIKPENIPEIVDTFIKNGAKEIMIDKLNLKPGILQNIVKTSSLIGDKASDKSNYDAILKTFFETCKEKKVKAISAF